MSLLYFFKILTKLTLKHTYVFLFVTYLTLIVGIFRLIFRHFAGSAKNYVIPV